MNVKILDRVLNKMEEEDKKVELDSDIWKKYEKKEAKSFNKILITIFLLAALVYVVKFLTGFFLI